MLTVPLRRAAVLTFCASVLSVQAFGARNFKGAATYLAHLAPNSVVVADFNGPGATANRQACQCDTVSRVQPALRIDVTKPRVRHCSGEDKAAEQTCVTIGGAKIHIGDPVDSTTAATI